MLINNVDENIDVKTINVSFETLHNVNINMKPLEILQKPSIVNHYLYNYLLISVLSLVIILIIGYQTKCKCIKQIIQKKSAEPMQDVPEGVTLHLLS